MKKYILKNNANKPVDLKIDYAKELNGEQLNVVQNGDGPCLVLAGAGSGKTRTLVYRVAWLLEHGVHPENILLVTFTNKAAKEMLDRVKLLLKEDITGLWGGTYHHIGNRTLRKHADALGLRNNFAILDQGDSEELVASAIAEIPYARDKKLFPKSRTVRSILSFSANSRKPISDIVPKYWYKYERYIMHFEYVQEAYAHKKRMSNSFDYDDLLTLWLELLQKRPSLKERYAQQFRYILVDEYQDTNSIQATIMNELASIHQNILVVGDDSQSIYSFRAANVQNILNFPDLFSGTKTFRLESNYRSTPEILKLANMSIRNNISGFEKTLKNIRESHGTKPALVPVPDNIMQARFIVQRIQELHDEDTKLKDVAVLFRASHQTLELEVELTKHNIPYIKRGGLKYFEQAHIKDVIAYLKVVINPLDEISWRRVLKLYEGIGDKSATNIWNTVRDAGGGFDTTLSHPENIKGLSSKSRKGMTKLHGVLMSINNLIKNTTNEKSVSELAKAFEIILSSGYRITVKEKFDDPEDRLDDLDQLGIFALNYESIEQFLSDVALSEGFQGEMKNQSSEDGDDDYLILSTIHQAKGLEWSVVFIIGLVEGQFPNARALKSPEDVEEERRLFYVATTRAKDELYLTQPMTSFFGSQMGRTFSGPSRFITELPIHTYERWQVSQNKFNGEDVIDLEDL